MRYYEASRHGILKVNKFQLSIKCKWNGDNKNMTSDKNSILFTFSYTKLKIDFQKTRKTLQSTHMSISKLIYHNISSTQQNIKFQNVMTRSFISMQEFCFDFPPAEH